MKFWMTNVDFYGERERRKKKREKVIDDTSHINNNTRRPSRRRCLHHCESCCLDPRCNNPDFSTFFFAIYWKYLGKFFFFDIQVPPKFLPKFRQSLPYTGGSQVIDIYPIYTSNISHLITQNHDPIILDLNPTHSHQHNTSYSITSYNVVQIKDSISTINMHGQKGTKSFNH
jgi:hypothetical protein